MLKQIFENRTGIRQVVVEPKPDRYILKPNDTMEILFDPGEDGSGLEVGIRE